MKDSELILIVERSEIIVKGLREIIHHTEYNWSLMEIDISDNIIDIIERERPKVIILNPTLLSEISRESFGSIIQSCKKTGTTILALIYAYFDPSIIEQFHNSIYINDTPQSIRNVLNKSIKEKEEAKETSTSLSQREVEVIHSIAMGLSNKEIAEKLFISIHTVISHRKNITLKLGVKSTSAITIYAVVNKIISEDDFKHSV